MPHGVHPFSGMAGGQQTIMEEHKTEISHLLKKVREKHAAQKEQAAFHKNLHRNLWIFSSTLSFAIALLSSNDLGLDVLWARRLSTVLALLLPFFTGYLVLRQPDKLWIAEIETRNQLSDLIEKIELDMLRNDASKYAQYESRYFEIMETASKRWLSLKRD
jgi:hypothetical protein